MICTEAGGKKEPESHQNNPKKEKLPMRQKTDQDFPDLMDMVQEVTEEQRMEELPKWSA